jgi:hypothetical protein
LKAFVIPQVIRFVNSTTGEILGDLPLLNSLL